MAKLQPDSSVHVNEREEAFLCREAPLTPGCSVALLYSTRGPELGRYWPGQFAEFVDPWDLNLTATKVRKRIPKSAWAVRLVGLCRDI